MTSLRPVAVLGTQLVGQVEAVGNPLHSHSSVMQIKESSHLVTPVLCVQFSHLAGSSSYPSSQFPTPLHQSKVLFIHLRHKKGIKDFASIFEVMVEEDLECVRDAVKNVLADFFR